MHRNTFNINFNINIDWIALLWNFKSLSNICSKIEWIGGKKLSVVLIIDEIS